jgi:hypothetical protein
MKSHQVARSDDGPPIAALGPCMRRVTAWQMGQDAHGVCRKPSRNAAARNVTDQDLRQCPVLGPVCRHRWRRLADNRLLLLCSSGLRGPLRPDTAHRRLRLTSWDRRCIRCGDWRSARRRVFRIAPLAEDPCMNGVGIMMHQASNGSLFLVAMKNLRAPTVIGLSCLQQQQTARTKPGIQVALVPDLHRAYP